MMNFEPMEKEEELEQVAPTIQLRNPEEDNDPDHYAQDWVTTVMMIEPYAGEGAKPSCTLHMEGMEELVRIGSASDIGRRSYQQDAVKVAEDYMYQVSQKLIAVLCDGMGGLQGGERASQLSTQLLYQAFCDVNVEDHVPEFFHAMVDMVDRQVCALKDEHGNPLRAGTTLASVILLGRELYWVSVGDSRIYLLREGELIQLTVDHNFGMLLAEKVRNGQMSRQEAETHPKREALVSFIGVGGPQYIDNNDKPLLLEDEDCILICSDGLYRTLSPEEILRVVAACGNDMQEAAEDLIAAALAKGSRHQDNTTAIMIKYVGTRQ